MKKRLLAWVLSFALALSLLPVGVLAAGSTVASGTCGDNLTWVLDSEGTLTISGEGWMDNYNEQDFFHGVHAPWSAHREQIESVIIEPGVTSIGAYSFFNCDNLSDVSIAVSVTRINKGAFESCNSLSDVTIPSEVTVIETSAFAGTNLSSIVIPDKVTYLGMYVFSGSKITSISLPKSIYLVDGLSLENMELENISVDDENEYYCSKDGVLYNKAMSSIIKYPQAKSGVAFTIPESVETIDYCAFEGCKSLTKVIIPENVSLIEFSAFEGCENLRELTIPKGVKSIGSSAFEGCKSLTEIIIPGGVSSIEHSVFEGCENLTELTIPESVETIGYHAFDGCRNLTEIAIPKGVSRIDGSAFEDCANLKSIVIPEGVSIIDYGTFSGCSKLEWIQIPASIEKIKSTAFYECKDLNDVYYSGSEAQWRAIDIYINENNELKRATIHYNSTGPDTSDPGESNQPQYILAKFTGYDEATKQVTIEEITSYQYKVTEETDLSFLENLEELKNKYVLIQYMPGDYDHVLDRYVCSVSPALAVAGNLQAVSEASITINGQEYPMQLSDWEMQESWLQSSIGRFAVGYLLNNKVVDVLFPEVETGTLESGTAESATIDGKEYGILGYTPPYLEDMASWINQEVGFYAVDNVLFRMYLVDPSFIPDIQDFDAILYQANYLYSSEEAPAQSVREAIGSTTPSETFVSALQDSGFEDAIAAWKAFDLIADSVDDITALHDFATEPKDLYSAVILNALEASVSYDIIDAEIEDAVQNCRDLISMVKDWMTSTHHIDISDPDAFKAMTDTQKSDLAEQTKNWFEKNQPDLTMLDSAFSGIVKGMNAMGDIEDYVERIVSCTIVANTNEHMKTVLRQVYQDSLATDNKNLQLALRDCVEIIDSSSAELLQKIISDEFVAVGTDAAKYVIKEGLWDTVTTTLETSFPTVAVFKTAYATGKFVSNLLVDTDTTYEQYLKMLAILDVESLVDTSFRKIESSFGNQKDNPSANVYLNALDLVFTLRDNDCLRGYNFVDVLDQTVVNQVAKAFGKDTYEEAKDYLRTCQVSYTINHETAKTAWIYELEYQYPTSGLYEYYKHLIEESAARVEAKEFIAACPVDVYVYDQEDKLIASIVDGVVSRDGDVMVALSGERKIVRFFDDQNYRIEYVGTDTGDMDVTISEFDGEGVIDRTVNYYNVALQKGIKYSIDAIPSESGYVLTDEATQDTVDCDYDSLLSSGDTYDVSVQSGSLLQNGEIFLSTKARQGETLELNAYVPEGAQFVRWEASNGQDIFADKNAPSTTFVMPSEDIVVKAVLSTNEETDTYTVSTTSSRNGTLTVNPTSAAQGDTVTLTVTPNSGYRLASLTVTDEAGNPVSLTSTGNGTYTFTMPASAVTASAAFTAIPQQPEDPDTPEQPEQPEDPDTPEQPAEPFTDVDETDWFYDEVVYVYANGLMDGVGGNRFAPDTVTNRAMLATILYRLAGEPDVSGDLPFTDVAAGQWYTDAVLWAAQNGIVNGVAEGIFAPMNTLTREQLVTMLYRYAEAEGYDVSAAADLSGYPDAGKVLSYAQKAMSWAVAEGIVAGMDDGTLNPAGNATRAQIATILMRFCEGVAQ